MLMHMTVHILVWNNRDIFGASWMLSLKHKIWNCASVSSFTYLCQFHWPLPALKVTREQTKTLTSEYMSAKCLLLMFLESCIYVYTSKHDCCCLSYFLCVYAHACVLVSLSSHLFFSQFTSVVNWLAIFKATLYHDCAVYINLQVTFSKLRCVWMWCCG